MKKGLLLLFFLQILTVKAQNNIHIEDVMHFWETFDSIQKITDKTQQIAYIQKGYVDKGSVGLQEFIAKRGSTAEIWQKMLDSDKEKLIRIRPYTFSVVDQKKILEEKIAYFKQLYPGFKEGEVFFIFGTGDTGGTTSGLHVLIGSEVMANEKPDWAISIVLHEFVHTQQKMDNYHLLAHCIQEGMADFVAELINKRSLTETYPGGYIDFGLKNEKAIWNTFKNYIGSNDEDGNYYNWLYGNKGVAINGVSMKDLGYFMGYQISKSYYNKTPDTTKALQDLLELDLSTDQKARDFLLQSGYVPKKDLKLVQNLQFGKIIETKKVVKKVMYGYKQTKNEVVFSYEIPKNIELNTVKSINIAGSQNGWNANDNSYKLKYKNKRIFELIVPKKQFEIGKVYTFKFVMNGDNWLNVPEYALNVEENGYGNLTFVVN
jgi:hypothetical protein